jgi:hypothetical protein
MVEIDRASERALNTTGIAHDGVEGINTRVDDDNSLEQAVQFAKLTNPFIC